MNSEKTKSLFEVARDVRKEHEEELAKVSAATRSETDEAPPQTSAIMDVSGHYDELDKDETSVRASE